MRPLLCVCLLGLALVIGAQQATGETTDSDEETAESPAEVAPSATVEANAGAQGVVYAYGVKLEGPYVFTESEDGKTLYLNGLIYTGPGEGPPPDITVTEMARSQHELFVSASELSRQAATYEGRKSMYADILRQSPLVESVREFEQGVYVTWRSSPGDEEEVIIPMEEPQVDPEQLRQSIKTRFWDTVNSGGILAFGKRYHVHIPPVRVAKTVEQIDLVRSGVSHDQLDTANTGLQNEPFLRDLYRAVQAPEEEKP